MIKTDYKYFLLIIIMGIILIGQNLGFPSSLYHISSLVGAMSIPVLLINPYFHLTHKNIFYILLFIIAATMGFIMGKRLDSTLIHIGELFLPVIYYLWGRISGSCNNADIISKAVVGVFLISVLFIIFQLGTNMLYINEYETIGFGSLNQFFSIIRFASFMGNPNIYSGFLTVVLIILITRYKFAYKYLSCFAFVLIAFLLTKSRIGLITMSIIFLIDIIKEKYIWRVIISLILIISVSFVYYEQYALILTNYRLMSIIDIYNSKSIQIRFVVSEIGISAIKNAFLWGNGFNSENIILRSAESHFFESASILLLVQYGFIIYCFYLLFLKLMLFSKNRTIIYIGLSMIIFDMIETVFVLKQLLCFIAFLYGAYKADYMPKFKTSLL